MAIKKMTYLDVPVSLRKARAGEVQAQVRGILSDVTASAEQRDFARKQLNVLQKWVSGSLPTEVEGAVDYHQIAEQIDQAAQETPDEE